MSVLLTAVILPIAFMLSPILPPIIGHTVGAVLDRMRRDIEEPAVVAVKEAKDRTAARHAVPSTSPAAQAA